MLPWKGSWERCRHTELAETLGRHRWADALAQLAQPKVYVYVPPSSARKGVKAHPSLAGAWWRKAGASSPQSWMQERTSVSEEDFCSSPVNRNQSKYWGTAGHNMGQPQLSMFPSGIQRQQQKTTAEILMRRARDGQKGCPHMPCVGWHNWPKTWGYSARKEQDSWYGGLQCWAEFLTLT